ncbi:uncharacterized protein BDZ99DRAFT_536163 [Mytilinidion resinicola]|uniref:T6SS Phospholipase effector Tle1-like catalytic domain-containing protein n=1 Tax=Mytilinidion resinicola TaxID=574789 RepID=A0A6A6YGB8_9PEZI|nr:uncharacterized protein BDZ99DRAFT_536163 [Mytilinidion resinicola]KAF2807085.1 hypothetical protein BDZ99DRAFT_536163 [Mytilinidion resinicola]
MAPQTPSPLKDRSQKRLIVLCDGTWQDSTSDSQTAAPTNVTRFARALSKYAPNPSSPSIQQIVYYQKGVGASPLSRLLGGAAGIGISANVREAYGFLANNYDAGDAIYFVGFSRGAYTARAVAGLVAACGLLTKKGMDSFPELYNLYYKEQETDARTTEAEKKAYGEKQAQFLKTLTENGLLEPAAAGAIEAVAVWDTVAFDPTWFSMTWVARLLGIEPERLEFRNAELSPKIRYGFHALALDETRNAFRPTLWQMPKVPPSANGGAGDEETWRLREMTQCWFSGKHSDVGGGYSQRWLSDITLAWMVAQCESRGLLAFDREYLLDLELPLTEEVEKYWGTEKGETSSDEKGFAWLVDKASRNLPLVSGYRRPMSLTDTNETIHCSIEDRHLGNNTGSKDAVRWPCGPLTGDRDGGKWEVKGKVKAYLAEAKSDELEQTFRGRIRAPVNSCVEDLHLRN